MVHLCFIVLSVTVCTVAYICLLCGDQIFVDFVSFLPMIIYVVLFIYMHDVQGITFAAPGF